MSNNTEATRIDRLLCKVGGHQWEKVPYTNAFTDVVGKCSRCGTEATGHEAATHRMDGSGPPSWLLEQDAEQELKARYLAGDIDEEELDKLLDEVVPDE